MNIIKFEEVANKIIEIRGEKVILDSDVAELYGVQTKEINQAVKNNPNKFPERYIFELTTEEWDPVKSKFLTSPLGGGKVKLPKAFTEKGLYMLATILKGPKATQTTIAIIEAFAKLRQLTRNIKELSVTKTKDTQKSLMQKSGNLIAEILDDGLEVSGRETSIEINFAVLKLKHTIKKTKK
ncbi:MAG TPA: DNA-binding protein [Elusimicrobia bacterium]|jgi:phage regulator Rha-like protein|nr:DNA-binding protein [Elusimicrobiota bacterium]